MSKKIMKNEEDLDFEISFYEGLLEKNPDFALALFALSDAYTKKGFFEKGLLIDKKLAMLKPDDSVIFYNLACDYSLLSQLENSLSCLTQALSLGYDDFEHLEKDPDLENLRREPYYKELLFKVKKDK
jgi:tetratricopeptide (TPR) repeat protein